MNRALKEGDQVGILVEATDPAGYYTHLHRMACIGKIPEDLQKQFEDEKELQALNLKMLKPGVDPMEMWNANNDFLRSMDIRKRPGSMPMARDTIWWRGRPSRSVKR